MASVAGAAGAAAANASVAVSNDSKEYNVVLKKGRGAKRQFNNKEGRLVSRQRVNAGGWVSVEIRGEEERVKWRNNAWDSVKKKRLALEDLKDDVLVHIFSFLRAGDHRAPASEQELSADYSEEYLTTDLSPEFVDIKMTLKDAMDLHKTVALLSKRFNDLCKTRLPSILGYLDADLIVNTWWHFAPWLTSNSLRLNSLKLKSGNLKDAAILLYILTSCDASKLTTLVALFNPVQPYHSQQTMVELAWYKKAGNNSNIVDVANFERPNTIEQAAADLGLPPGLYREHRVGSSRNLHDAIANYCPVVTTLKLYHGLVRLEEPSVLQGALFRQKSIRQLHLVAVVSGYDTLDGRSYPTISISQLIGLVPNLKVFKISRCSSDFFSIIRCQSFQISSQSLQLVDVRDSGKHIWVRKCKCPNLKRLVCRGTAYGNGVRPRADIGAQLDLGARDSEYLAGTTRFDGFLMSNGPMIEFGELEVPDSCVVVVTDY